MTTTMRYILDTSAVLQQPEVLATAATRRLLIPKAVLAELTTRGREHLQSLVGSLINQAVNAGAEIIDSPAHLKNDLIASDRFAQRLSNADIDIARSAIALNERTPAIPVSVVTLDKDLIHFLRSRGIPSITPAQLLTEASKEAPDAKTLNSAKSLSTSQRTYMVVSALVGALASFAGNLLYSNALYLVNTVSVWGTLIALPVLGVALFWYRQRFRFSYGIFEFLVGVMMSSYVFFPSFTYSGITVVQGIQVIGGLYVMVRGLDNLGKGVEGTRFQALWNRVFS